MEPHELKLLLTAVREGHLSVEDGFERLRRLPFEDVGIAMIDHHRSLRQGIPEVVLGEAKSAEQLTTIVARMAEHGGNLLVTRLDREKAGILQDAHPEAA
ncbi:MAG TPA: 1-(5-phosphoribosyl)-5-amino-4-imidazole-carboxylate carboxylase, partial [Desulfuromonadales bacterium]|nr:1-(5-phosphoribosyl)-5-amino-4-imidazole-carboxylate carboxylase [Desulfuromonadales bacterium]